ncbi:histidine phosphatase family protein [Brachybacterium sp. JB7]|uniref:histidine phosphatase family protein n=1 Tax=Brachybacterium TaxID=43668 RepID=UPI000DF2D489|nr:histidine phosphatase family protein [Brachybacterium sp. JB7]RCS66976.1 histidine phosphatase family protein [Brachybacterium sp. JB7]
MRAERRIHLLRHAMPVPDPTSSPSDWPLSSSGRFAAAAQRDRVPDVDRVLSSQEIKAVETARLATGRERHCDPRFGEVIRPGEPYDDDVRARRRAWVQSLPDTRHHGWETLEEAARRFGDAVQEHPDEDLLIATHGMVMTAWLAGIGALRQGRSAADYWDALPFPSLVTIRISADPRIIPSLTPTLPRSLER